PYSHPRPLPSFPTRRSSDLLLFADAQRVPDLRPTRPPRRQPHQPPAGHLVPTRLHVPPGTTQLVLVPPFGRQPERPQGHRGAGEDRKSTRLNSSHLGISYAV